ncbi:S1 family peptidase [Bradyrhizobium japonicum]|uniref:S1 family peptidase n=1 Tax=Bradyrhizobium japonicum TaxID=375 RepID=UPI0009B8CB56|nr:serine protease [Bradyrhizobium japonicum]
MIQPTSIAEQLMYSTVRIIAQNGAAISRGTGFFYNFPLKEEGQVVPAIITNRHVVQGSISQNFLLHLHDPKKGEKAPSGTFNVNIQAGLGNGWTEHPDPNVDLCVLPIAQIQNKVPAPHQPFYVPLGGVPGDEELKKLDAVEQVLMIGYPNGLWDHVNNLPLIRRGVTASHPGVDYQIEGQSGPGVTVIDMACFPGSSGSPVFIYNQGTIPEKNGNVSLGTRAIFLGVLFSGPVWQQDGNITVKNIPTKSVPVAEISTMINLGYVIKPREIVALGRHLYAKNGMVYPD